MVSSHHPGTGPGAVHRHRQLSEASEGRLRTLGARVPDMTAEELRPLARERAVRAGRRLLVTVVVVLVLVFLGVQLLRPVPSPVFRASVAMSVRLPGSLPALPWPATGAAAMSVEGAGSLGHAGSTRSAPVAGLATVMTAYVVLKDHPLAPGAAGPSVPVTAGESLTELQALEGLLVAPGNAMALLLSDWDASSTSAFVDKMNGAARRIGLNSTTFTDPSGLDPGSVSTPNDLIRLGEAALAIPTFRQIVAMPQVTLPLAGVVYNLDFDLGRDGIIGIKTGSDAAAGGCFLFAAQHTVDAKPVALVGAVLGQGSSSPNTAAVDEADALVKRAFADIAILQPVAPGQVVGRVDAPWGVSTPVTASSAARMVGWPGLSVPVRLDMGGLPSAISTGAQRRRPQPRSREPGRPCGPATRAPLGRPAGDVEAHTPVVVGRTRCEAATKG